MRFIVEFDGVVADVRGVHYALYRDVAADVGWSRLDEATYWRLIRRHGLQADVLPGARPATKAEFTKRFVQQVEESDRIASCPAHPSVARTLAALARHGTCLLVTIGSNAAARHDWVVRAGWAPLIQRLEMLSDDPRRRGVELRVLSEGDPRTMVIAAGDAIVRAAGAAGLFSVGISSGTCTRDRLHQAGADFVYAELCGLTESLDSGAEDLVRAGLLPASLG